MESLVIKNYIDAITAMNQAVQRMRFQLAGQDEHILDSPVGESINNEIKNQYGLDLHSLEAEEDLLKYGEYLQEKLNSKIKEFYYNSSLNEEIELLEAAKDYPIEDFQRRDFSKLLKHNPVKDLSKGKKGINFTKNVLNSVGVPLPNFLFSIRHPEKVQMVDLRSGDYPSTGTRHFLVSSKLRVRNKELFILCDLVEPHDEPTILYACGCFFFEQTNNRIGSPVRMFLQGVNEYGNEIDLEGAKKHFFLQKKIEKPDSMLEEGLKHKTQRGRGTMTLFFSIARKASDILYQFSYMVLGDEIIGDAKKGIFL